MAPARSGHLSWPLGGGEMAARIRAHDWAATPLGPVEAWPGNLRAVTDLLLAGGFPMVALWGPDLVQIYNDGYRALMGAKHPAGLGRPTQECWPEIRHVTAPLYERVRAGGETLTFEDKLHPVARHGDAPEDAWFTLSYSPLRDEAGAVAGVLVTVLETTATVRAEKQLRFERDLLEAVVRQAAPGISTVETPGGRALVLGEQAREIIGHGEPGPDAGRRAEGALQASEKRYRAFVVAGSDVVYRMSPDWSRMHRLDGQGFLADTAEPTESWMERYIPPDDHEVVQDAIDQAIRAKGMFELEHRVRRADGMPGWTLSRAIPILDGAGQIAEWLGAAKDITARRLAAEALRESEERFRGFAENSADVLWIANRGGTRLEYLSPAFERVFGEGRGRVMADLRRWRELVHPEDRAMVPDFMSRAAAGAPAIAHYRAVHPADGRVVHVRDTGFLIRDASGAITHVAGVVQDVSDLERAASALRGESGRFRTLAEGIPQLVWRSGDDGLWTWASPQWLAFTGQTQEQSRGRGWLDAIHPDDHEATVRAWHEAQRSGRLDMEHRVRRAADGAWRWHAARSVPLRGAPEPGEAEGRVLEWLGTMTDIDDLKRLQGQQQVLVAELQHRTRNLLAVARTLARRSIGPSPGRDEYDARLAALGRVQGFLSRASIYAVPLRDIVQAELAATDGGVSERVTVRGPAVDLPGEGVQAVALALHELATNAVKYGALAQSSGRLSVTWRVEESGGDARLVIDWRESGVSMPSGPPARRGYGTELITVALPYQLDAETALEFAPGGVRCRIALPAGAFRGEAGRRDEADGA